MKLKKLLASVSALAIAMSTMIVPVAADEINGDTVYVDKTIYNITLPTTASQNFFLDPAGLIDASAGAADADGDKVLTQGTEGNIYGTTPMVAINNSSVNVDLKATLSITGTGVEIETTTSAVTTAESTTKPAVCMTASFAKAATSKDVTIAAAEVPIKTTADTQTIQMAPAKYDYVLVSGSAVGATSAAAYAYKMDSTSTGSAVNITLGGKCNKNGDWSNFGSLKVTAVFKFCKSGSADEVENTVPGSIPTSNGTTDIVITYTGANPSAGNIIFTKPDGSTWTPPASAYSATGISINTTNKTITLTTNWIAGVKYAFGTGTYKLTVNGTAYSFKFE